MKRIVFTLFWLPEVFLISIRSLWFASKYAKDWAWMKKLITEITMKQEIHK